MTLLPDRLGRVSPLLRRLLLPLWLLLFGTALLGQGGGLWYGHSYVTLISPAFTALGLDDESAKGARGFTIGSRQAGPVPSGSRILRIDGHALPLEATQLEAARILKGREGSRAALDIRTPDGSVRRVTLTRDSARNAASIAHRRNLVLGFAGISGLLAITYAVAAFLLWRRRSDDSVSTLLSFAFLAIAGSGLGPFVYYDQIGAHWLLNALLLTWILLLLIALPAFPDGRFVPRWSRWLVPLAPAFLVINFVDVLPDAVTGSAFVLMILISLSAPFLRYHRTPPGTERQQLKWAALGLGAGTVLLTAGSVLLIVSSKVALGLPEIAVAIVSLIFLYAGFLLIPAGVLVSLLRYRLNDADAAIGRSTGYAGVTAIVGAVWAISAYWAQEMLPDIVGEENKALATAIAALVAVGIIGPVRTRLLRWAEARFQRALVRLRGLPVRLGQLQHGDDPTEVAQVALEALERGIEAGSCAIVDSEGERLAVRGGPGPYPLKLELADAAGLVATLLIGPRSDGAPYNRDQRSAIGVILPALADALRATSRRRRDKAALGATLAAIERRLAGLEGRIGGPADSGAEAGGSGGLRSTPEG